MVAHPRGGHAAIVVGDDVVDFSALQRRAAEDSRRLSALPAAVLEMTAAPSVDFVSRFLAALEARRPVAIFSSHWTTEELRTRRAMLGPSLSLAPDGSVASATTGDIRCHPQAAVVLFTTGSSGSPKAVQLSRESIEANVAAVISSLGLEGVAEQTLFLPLSSGFGLLGQLLPALRAGVTTRLLPRFIDAQGLIDRRQMRGMWSGVPSHWEALLRLTDGSRDVCAALTHVVSAGAALPVALRTRLQERFPAATLFSCYGQTEAGPRVACLSSAAPEFFSPVAGRPVPGIELRTEDGELCVRGPQVMLGYLGDEAGTARVLREGWLHTGDAARLSADGLLTIEGRRDDLFNVAGERTSPVEIEQALVDIPAVREAAILVTPESVYGARIEALLVLEPGCGATSARELSAALAGRLVPHKHPRAYYSVDALPRFPNGKLRRAELAAAIAGGRKL